MKITTLLSLAVAFAIGTAAGACVVRLSQEIRAEVMDTSLLTSTLAANTGLAIAYLYRLRDGKTDEVISILEMKIDSELVLLSDRLVALPLRERDVQHLQIIKMHKDYREKHPYSNSVPYISEGVLKAYTLLTSGEK